MTGGCLSKCPARSLRKSRALDAVGASSTAAEDVVASVSLYMGIGECVRGTMSQTCITGSPQPSRDVAWHVVNGGG
jgi:hypothetical protein